MARTRSTHGAGNLGAEVTTFVGRRHEAAEVKRLLSTSRLATLTGVGGVGKTRLALRVAGELARGFDDGAWFVDLAPLDDDGLLTQTVASSLGLQDRSSGWSISVVANHLRDKELLLVLDNCEHLRDACAVLVDALMRAAPDLRVLTTSRQTLGLTGEQVFHVPPLSLPSEAADGAVASVAHFEAINLFVERARAVRPGFELSADNVSTVSAVCRRLDGVPLAIELAAARLSAISVHDLLERLEDRFQLLTGGSAAALPRHQALRELIRWSWDLCSEGERILWGRMSVFPSHFDLSAAEYICRGGLLEESRVLDHLTALVEKTIVMAQEENGRIRYRMLETLREYGREQLQDAGEADAVRSNHRQYYCDLVGHAATEWASPRQKEWLARFRLEHSNLRIALDASFDEDAHVESGLDMVSDLWLFWIASGATSEARRWLDRGLERARTPGPARTRALTTCGYLCLMEEDVVSARRMLGEARAGASAEPDSTNATRVIYVTALAALSEGDLDSAQSLLEEILPTQKASGDHFGHMDTSFCLAAAAALRGQFDRAETLMRAAIQASDDVGESWSKGYMLWCLGFVDLQRNQLEAASAHAHDALVLARALDDPWAIACSFELLAWIAAASEQAERAARLLGAARGIWGRTGVSLFGIRDLTHRHDQCVSDVQEKLGGPRFQVASDQGAEMELDLVIKNALGESTPDLPPPGGAPTLLAPLTKRESEVALLVAQGLTNKDVAARLVISQRTAEAHLERILSKLGYTSRTQVATWVVAQAGTTPS